MFQFQARSKISPCAELLCHIFLNSSNIYSIHFESLVPEPSVNVKMILTKANCSRLNTHCMNKLNTLNISYRKQQGKQWKKC